MQHANISLDVIFSSAFNDSLAVMLRVSCSAHNHSDCCTFRAQFENDTRFFLLIFSLSRYFSIPLKCSCLIVITAEILVAVLVAFYSISPYMHLSHWLNCHSFSMN